MDRIAILITCFSRKEKTLACLKSISEQEGIDKYQVEIFIVDGGSKDGTIEAVREQYPQVHIELHDGLYWAGGMRAAWKMADAVGTFDYYWLLNDDTALNDNCLSVLMAADVECRRQYGKAGIIVGATCNADGEYTYGGIKLNRLNHSKGHTVVPSDDIQPIDLGNANIMLIPVEVCQKVGHLCVVYTHGCADQDYTLRARHKDIPVLLAPGYLGVCDNDHGRSWKSQKTSLKERLDYLYSPKGLHYHDYLYYVKTFFPSEYISSWIKLWVKTLFPIMYTMFKKENRQHK